MFLPQTEFRCFYECQIQNPQKADQIHVMVLQLQLCIDPLHHRIPLTCGENNTKVCEKCGFVVHFTFKIKHVNIPELPFYAPGLKGLPGASSNPIGSPSVLFSVSP